MKSEEDAEPDCIVFSACGAAEIVCVTPDEDVPLPRPGLVEEPLEALLAPA